jgi:MHS family proline/betaine transporter-like MFS transporter
VRFSGIALSYNASVLVFSGFAPLLATMLIRETGSLAAPAYFVIGTLVSPCSQVLHCPLADRLRATDCERIDSTANPRVEP